MVIIRVGLANRANHSMHTNLGHASSVHSVAGDRRSRVQFDITPLNKVDDGQRSSISPTSHVSSEKNRRSEIRFDDIKEEV